MTKKQFAVHKKRRTSYEVIRRDYSFPLGVDLSDQDGIVLSKESINFDSEDVILHVQISIPSKVSEETLWVIYRSIHDDRRYYLRPQHEFDDGRFLLIEFNDIMDVKDVVAALRSLSDQLDNGALADVTCGAVVLEQAGSVDPILVTIGPQAQHTNVLALLRAAVFRLDMIADRVGEST